MRILISAISILLILRFMNKSSNGIIATCKLLALITSFSIIYFLGILTNLNNLIVQLIILTVSISVNVIAKKKDLVKVVHSKFAFRLSDIFTLIFCLIGLLLFNRYSQPFGAWDAQAIWNLRASFLIYPDYWKNGFNALLVETHPNYPLFVPLSIVAICKYSLLDLSQASSVFHLGIFGLLLILLFQSSKEYSNGWLATFSILLICLNRSIVAKAASQYADTSMALFLLACIILAYKNCQEYFLTGLICATLLWIKNEGIVPFLIFTIFFIYSFKNKFRNLLIFASGILIVLIPFVYFKVNIVQSIDYLETVNASEQFAQIFELNRFKLILKWFAKNCLYYFPAIIPIILLNIVLIREFKLKREARFFLLLGLTFLGYSSAYLFTPYEAEWHIQNSYDRLIHQLFPAFLFLSIMTFRHSKKMDEILLVLPK